MAYSSKIQKTQGVAGWPVGVERFYPYADSLACAQADAAFDAMSNVEQIAASTLVEPTVANKNKQLRDCAGTVVGEVVVEGYPSEWGLSGSTGPVTTTGNGLDYQSYTNTRTFSDFRGTAAVTTAAPKIVIQQKTAPRANGGRYVFEPQRALNTIEFLRHDTFGINRIVTFTGPNYLQQSGNILNRGWGAVTDATPDRGNITRTKLILNVSGNYSQAGAVADALAAINASDPRIPWLRGWANSNYLIDNRDAAIAFGRRAYSDFQNSDWTNGAELFGVTPNFEVHRANPASSADVMTQYYNMLGWFMEGMRLEAVARGQTPAKLIGYDYAGLTFQSLSTSSKRQDASGTYTDAGGSIPYQLDSVKLPFWLNPARMVQTFGGGTLNAPLTANNPYAQYFKTYGGFIGSQEYMRNTWPRGRSKWQKDANGVNKTRTGKNGVKLLVAVTDAFRTVINGEECDILGKGHYSEGEADNYQFMQEERFAFCIGDRVFLAGKKHNSLSTDRQDGWGLVDLVQWNRTDGEFKQTNEVMTPDGSALAINPATGAVYDVNALNYRPLNPDMVANDLFMQLSCGKRMARYWSGPQPKFASSGGSVVGTTYSYIGDHSYATQEVIQDAMNVWSQFNWLDTQVTQILCPILPVVDCHRDRSWYDPRQEHEKKMRIVLNYCKGRTDRNGKPYVQMWADYVAQDDGITSDLKAWICKRGTNEARTGAYLAKVGNSGFIDDWQLPDDCTDVEPADWRFQYTDMTGETRTFSGDYLVGELSGVFSPPATV